MLKINYAGIANRPRPTHKHAYAPLSRRGIVDSSYHNSRRSCTHDHEYYRTTIHICIWDQTRGITLVIVLYIAAVLATICAFYHKGHDQVITITQYMSMISLLLHESRRSWGWVTMATGYVHLSKLFGGNNILSYMTGYLLVSPVVSDIRYIIVQNSLMYGFTG